MTSMPESRRARAMILAPRSCPSKPGLATTTRILRAVAASIAAETLARRRPEIELHQISYLAGKKSDAVRWRGCGEVTPEDGVRYGSRMTAALGSSSH